MSNSPRLRLGLWSGLLAAVLAPACALLGGSGLESWELKVRPFGTTKAGEAVEEYELRAPDGVVVRLITLGATVRELHVPDGDGRSTDVVLGFDDVSGYEGEGNQYFGCVVGRVANRIAAG